MEAARLLACVSGLPLPEAAAQFAAAGVAVFPCVPGGKRPLTSHGFRDARADLGRVRRWWVRWPEANVGLPTGMASGLDVVDIDVHGGVSGFAGFERARRAGLVDGWAALARTPSGGIHAYYPAEPACPQPSWQAAAACVDFRGTGGYVVAPPSVIAIGGSRVAYELIATGKTAPTPVDAVALREFLDPRPTSSASASCVVGAEVEVARLAGWVASRGEGERNRGLFWAACRLAETGVGPEVAYAALGPAAERAGLRGAEVAATIRSAYRTTTASSAPAGGPDGRPRRAPRLVAGQVLP